MRGSKRVNTWAFHRPLHPPLWNGFAEKIPSHSLGGPRRVAHSDHPDRIRGAARFVFMIPEVNWLLALFREHK